MITVTPRGFEPAEIARPAGPFVLMAENRGRREVSLRLDREVGGSVNEKRVPLEVPDWSELLDLTPGRYVLADADDPERVCLINITP